MNFKSRTNKTPQIINNKNKARQTSSSYHGHGRRRIVAAGSGGAAVGVKLGLFARVVPQTDAGVLWVARHYDSFDPFPGSKWRTRSRSGREVIIEAKKKNTNIRKRQNLAKSFLERIAGMNVE